MTIQTAKQRQEAFMADFKAMCAKHKATVSIEYETTGYGYGCGAYMEVAMPGEWDAEGETTAEWTDFQIKNYDLP